MVCMARTSSLFSAPLARPLAAAALAVAAVQALVACSALPSDASMPPSSATRLAAYHWQLQQVQNAAGTTQPDWLPPPQAERTAQPLQLDFSADGAISVRNLCNQAGGRYQLQGTQMRIGPLASTRKACADTALMELEDRVNRQLPQAAQWRLDTDSRPPTLQLQFADGSRWTLQGTPTYTSLYGAPERLFWEIAPNKRLCSHGLIPNYQCLQVRKVTYDDKGLKTELGPWENFYGAIEGYEHQDGMRTLLRLQRYERRATERQPVPADASRYLYVLDMVVESERVR